MTSETKTSALSAVKAFSGSFIFPEADCKNTQISEAAKNGPNSKQFLYSKLKDLNASTFDVDKLNSKKSVSFAFEKSLTTTGNGNQNLFSKSSAAAVSTKWLSESIFEAEVFPVLDELSAVSDALSNIEEMKNTGIKKKCESLKRFLAMKL